MRLSAFLILTALFFVLISSAVRNRKRQMPLWLKKLQNSQGPNVCVIEEAPQIKRTFWTECKIWTSRMVCGRKTRLRFDCCEGYEHIPGEPGCAGVKPLRNLYHSARYLGGSEFLRYADLSGLSEKLNNGGPYTLFLPTNKAFDNIPVDVRKSLQSKDSSLAYHLARGMQTIDSMRGDMSLESFYKGEKLKINKYPNGVITVNCAPLLRPDIQATNGVIHLVDKIIIPSFHNSLSEVLQKDPRFNVFSSAVKKAGGNLEEKLKGRGPYTVFAPSDEAFSKIPSGALEKIMNSPEALEALVRYHVVDRAICSPMVMNLERGESWQGERVSVKCNTTGLFYDEETQLKSMDHLASNGIIHMVDRVLLPDPVKSMDIILREKGLNKFANYFGVAGLSHLLTDSSVTIFAPDDKAFEEFLKQKNIDVSTNSKDLRTLLEHHVIRGKFETTDLMNSQVLNTFGNRTVHIQIHRQKPMTVDSATVKTSNIAGINGVLYIMDKVMVPAHEDFYQWVASNPRYSILYRMIQKAGPEIIDILKSLKTSSRTFFAPDDDAFLKLHPGMIERMVEDPELLIRILKYHIVDEYVVTSGLQDNVYYNYYTLEGRPVKIQKNGDYVTVNNAVVEIPDCASLNGVVQTVNSLLIPIS